MRAEMRIQSARSLGGQRDVARRAGGAAGREDAGDVAQRHGEMGADRIGVAAASARSSSFSVNGSAAMRVEAADLRRAYRSRPRRACRGRSANGRRGKRSAGGRAGRRPPPARSHGSVSISGSNIRRLRRRHRRSPPRPWTPSGSRSAAPAPRRGGRGARRCGQGAGSP